MNYRMRVSRSSEKMKGKINVETDITEVKRIGDYTENKNRPVLVELRHWSKMEILREVEQHGIGKIHERG